MPSSNETSGFHPRIRSAFLIENQLLVESCITVDGEASFRLPIRSATFDAIADTLKSQFRGHEHGTFFTEPIGNEECKVVFGSHIALAR